MAPCLFMCMYMNICMCMGSGLNIGIRNFANPDFYPNELGTCRVIEGLQLTNYDKNLKITFLS